MKRFLLLLITGTLSISAFAQDFPFGKVDNQALEMKQYDKDTSAHAVVINEHGIAKIVETNSEDVDLVYDYHVIIKFFDDKEFDRYGTFKIRLYSSDGESYDKLSSIKAVTYYKDDAGNVQQAELDPKKIYSVVEDKHNTIMKFALPSLRKGCVVEIKYEVESPYYWNHFHTWMFQGYIPKMNSEFEAHIPGFWTYNASLRGNLKLTKNKTELETQCFTYHGAKADCSYLDFGISDVPAFKEEEFMTSANNYLSGVYFQLVEFTNLNTGAKEKYSTDWKDIDRQLKEDYWFGGQLKRKDLMKDHIAGTIAGKTDSLEKAKAVYAFIQKSFKWNEIADEGSVDGIRKALEAHTGNSGDINLALVAALNAANIPTQAVLLSTRDNGNINKLFPTTNDFDYVIARTTISGKTYMLDATDPMLPFGMLPLRCLNDQGRVFSLDKPSYWTDMTTKQRESTTYSCDLTLQSDGKLKGTITRYSTDYSSYLKRREIKKYNSIDEYVDHVAEDVQHIKILKSDITGVDTLDNPVSEVYEVEMNLDANGKHDRLSFNPYFIGQIKTNPFKLAQRDFPVDWGMPSNERYIVTIHIPAQYTLESAPQAISFAMPNHGGQFATDFQSNNGILVFSYVTKVNNSVYGPEEYPYLKELYNKIILAEKSELVFKKKS